MDNTRTFDDMVGEEARRKREDAARVFEQLDEPDRL